MDFDFVTLLLVTDLKFSRKYLVVSETIITDHHHLSEHRGIRRPGRLGTSQTERSPFHD